MGRERAQRWRDRGFTLYEVIVVMALILIMSAIVAPSFAAFFPGHKVQKAAEGLAAAAGKARMDAVSTLRKHRLVIVPTSPPSFHLTFEADPLQEPGVFHPLPNDWGRPETLPEDVGVESTDGAGDDESTGEKYIEFDIDGTTTGGTVRLSHPRAEPVTLTVDPVSGKAALQEAVAR